MRLPSKGTALDTDMRNAWKLVLQGTCVVIDPSVGSGSSMPGWAVMSCGEVLESGTVDLVTGGNLPLRLQALATKMHQLVRTWKPDCMIYEDVPPSRFGGGNANAHASLLKAVGVVLSIPGPVTHIGMKPKVWKSLARPTYVKSDENDALEMAWIAKELAYEYEKIAATQKTKKTGKTASGKMDA